MLECHIPCAYDPNPRCSVSQRESHHGFCAYAEHEDRIIESFGDGWVSSGSAHDPIEQLVDNIGHHVRRLPVFGSLRRVTDRFERVDGDLLETTLSKFKILLEIYRAIWVGEASDCTHPKISARIGGVNPIHSDFCFVKASTCSDRFQIWVA